jgi:hypothetical protein
VEVDGFELHFDPEPEPGEEELHNALPKRVDAWRRRSASGAILTGIALGLKQVLEPRRDEPAIVAQVSGDPVGDLPVEAHLDGIKPANSVVTNRPWLLEDGDHHDSP